MGASSRDSPKVESSSAVDVHSTSSAEASGSNKDTAAAASDSSEAQKALSDSELQLLDQKRYLAHNITRLYRNCNFNDCRAEAREALKEFSSATMTRENGPV